jgi:hypothetical protein
LSFNSTPSSATSSVSNSPMFSPDSLHHLTTLKSNMSPLASTRLFKDMSETTIRPNEAFNENMSSECNVIRSLLRALNLISKITTASRYSQLGKETRSWCSSMLTSSLTGIHLWIGSHPTACSIFFAFGGDSMNLLTVSGAH